MKTRKIYINENNHFAYEEVIFDEWKELRQYFFDSKDNFSLTNYVYRGHADSSWSIKPTIERIRPEKIDPFFSEWYKNAEKVSIDFYNRAFNIYADRTKFNIDKSNRLEWLAV